MPNEATATASPAGTEKVDIRVGEWVHWFGDGNVNSEPNAAMVSKVMQGSGHAFPILHLTVWLPGKGIGMSKRAIRHVDDPFFDASKQALKIREGAWGMIR